MHQPYYKDPLTGVYRLPWVRLHGIKDYYDMTAILEDFPAVHQTFNLVPSLIEQLMDYIEGRAIDRFSEVSKIPAEDLTIGQKTFILSNFFLANLENMIKPFPRYHELFYKRGEIATKEDINRAIRYFLTQDFLDLQVLFNLSWFDPIFHKKYPYLQELINKGKNYTEEEKKSLLKTQIEVLRLITPEYKRLKEKGQIEISTSPFYHPILPLLYNTISAKVALPHVKLPENTFSHPEDVSAQIRMALEYFEGVFGFRPEGMWPSEGSVSQDIVKLIEEAGIKWIATDEGILSASLGIPLRDSSGHTKEPHRLYQPYTVGDNLSIIFRDHTLSDLIGFVYKGWDAKKAVDDFIGRLYRIKTSLPKDKAFIAPIILDGENAWEHYKNDGRDFLLYLYERLSKEEWLACATVSEYLKGNPPHTHINNLFAGSWINSNFSVWIGHEEDNIAWDMLYETRQSLSAHQQSNLDADLREAWQAIYIAEGSDWCWWYGDEHVTETRKEFDELFRANLIKVYKIIGKEAPKRLHLPILKEDRKIKPTVGIRGFITPKIDGEITSYYEWLNASRLDVEGTGGTMHMAETFISTIYYGFDLDNLYLRIDAKKPLIEISSGITFSFHFLKPTQIRIDVSAANPQDASHKPHAILYTDSEWKPQQFIKDIETLAINDILEIAVPFAFIGAKERDEIIFFLSILRDGSELERCPMRGCISLEAPRLKFEATMWQ